MTGGPTPFPRGTLPYSFPEETRVIGDHRDVDSWPIYDDAVLLTGIGGKPFTLYGCYLGYADFGLPLFSHTGETNFDPETLIIQEPIANVSRFSNAPGLLRVGNCYKMAVISRGTHSTFYLMRDGGWPRPKFEAYTYHLIHPNMWQYCGRAPLPDLADIDC